MGQERREHRPSVNADASPDEQRRAHRPGSPKTPWNVSGPALFTVGHGGRLTTATATPVRGSARPSGQPNLVGATTASVRVLPAPSGSRRQFAASAPSPDSLTGGGRPCNMGLGAAAQRSPLPFPSSVSSIQAVGVWSEVPPVPGAAPRGQHGRSDAPNAPPRKASSRFPRDILGRSLLARRLIRIGSLDHPTGRDWRSRKNQIGRTQQ